VTSVKAIFTLFSYKSRTFHLTFTMHYRTVHILLLTLYYTQLTIKLLTL